MPVTVDLERCNGNGACVDACAFFAVELRDGKAVIFDNCTDCAACVLACPTHAITSDVFPDVSGGDILAVDFAATSAIAAVVDRFARDADTAARWCIVDPSDAAGAATAIVKTVQEAGAACRLVVLPHAGSGPAIAGRVAALLSAHLLAGCRDIALDSSGTVRARRPLFGGRVMTTSRVPAGLTVMTLLPRANEAVNGAPVQQAVPAQQTGTPPPKPAAMLRRVVGIDAAASDSVRTAAEALAQRLGADVIDPASAGTRPLSLDLYIAVGIKGNTEQNALFRESRVVVAIVDDPQQPVAQIADFLLAGDVAENVKALVAAL